jgi:hypothetical protein
MKAVLIDASSAILLFKADLLQSMAVAFELCVVPAVFEEITVVGREGAAEFEAALAGGGLKMVAPPGLPAGEALAGLGAGERDTLRAFEQGAAHFVIIDDRKGAIYCRDHRIPYINALLCPNVLRAAGYLSNDACAAAFDHLLLLGRYGRWVVTRARSYSAHELDGFLPVPESPLDRCSRGPRLPYIY